MCEHSHSGKRITSSYWLLLRRRVASIYEDETRGSQLIVNKTDFNAYTADDIRS